MAKKVKKNEAVSSATADEAQGEGKKVVLKPLGKEGLAEYEAPLVSASSMQIAVAGNEVVLVFLQNRPRWPTARWL